MKMKALALALGALTLGGCVLYEDRARTREVVPAVDPLSVSEIIAMSNGGMTAETIAQELARHGVERRLTADDIIQLKESGVDDAVVRAAVEAQVKSPTPTRIVEEVEVPVYYRTYYDPGWTFGLGYLYGWGIHGHRHSHHHHGWRGSVRAGVRW